MTKVKNLASIAVSTRIPEGAQLCEILDDAGNTCHGYEINGALVVVAMLTPSAATVAATAPVLERMAAKDTADRRIKQLGRRAARFALDPAANLSSCFFPGVFSAASAADKQGIRVLHELVARLALDVAAEDATEVAKP